MKATKKLATRVAAANPRTSWIRQLGPGLITGASDDDPSGITTYSQAGAQFGYALSWTLLLSYPLMVVIQEISARIGRVTGRGLAANMKRRFPVGWVYALLSLLFVANVINLAADLSAMGASVQMLIGGSTLIYIAAFGVASVSLQIWVSYRRYANGLKWLTVSLFAYVAVAFIADVPWAQVARSLIVPTKLNREMLTMIVAVLGTTISPYLFFWQASTEVEDEECDSSAKPLRNAPAQATKEFSRIRLDTCFGMGVSNVIALFIMVTAAATLHAKGITHIDTAQQAAQALAPIAGSFASALFALGIIATGLLALPVLAGSAAYALGELRQWPIGLNKRPRQAKRFYGAIALLVLIAILLNIFGVDPIKALVWSAVVNGVIAVPIMIATMLLGSNVALMGKFTLPRGLRIMGWIATGTMGLAAVGLLF